MYVTVVLFIADKDAFVRLFHIFIFVVDSCVRRKSPRTRSSKKGTILSLEFVSSLISVNISGLIAGTDTF
jgi:hypothetical protein